MSHLTDRQAAEQLGNILRKVSIDALVLASGRSPEGVRHWREGTRCPTCASLVNLAKRIPAVREWLLDQVSNPKREDPS